MTDVPIHIRGSHLALGEVVPRRFPRILAGDAHIASHQFKVLNNGSVLDFAGGITFGTAKEFEIMLKAMDNVRTVRLNSNGGRIAETI